MKTPPHPIGHTHHEKNQTDHHHHHRTKAPKHSGNAIDGAGLCHAKSGNACACVPLLRYLPRAEEVRNQTGEQDREEVTNEGDNQAGEIVGAELHGAEIKRMEKSER